MIEAKDVTPGWWVVSFAGSRGVVEVTESLDVCFTGSDARLHTRDTMLVWIHKLDLTAIAQKEETKCSATAT
jgi:hypothetical protein